MDITSHHCTCLYAHNKTSTFIDTIIEGYQRRESRGSPHSFTVARSWDRTGGFLKGQTFSCRTSRTSQSVFVHCSRTQRYSPGCDHGDDKRLLTTTQTSHSDKSKASTQRSSVFDSIFLASGDGGGDDSDLIHYRAQFVTLELRVLSAIGGLPRVSFV